MSEWVAGVLWCSSRRVKLKFNLHEVNIRGFPSCSSRVYFVVVRLWVQCDWSSSCEVMLCVCVYLLWLWAYWIHWSSSVCLFVCVCVKLQWAGAVASWLLWGVWCSYEVSGNRVGEGASAHVCPRVCEGVKCCARVSWDSLLSVLLVKWATCVFTPMKCWGLLVCDLSCCEAH